MMLILKNNYFKKYLVIYYEEKYIEKKIFKILSLLKYIIFIINIYILFFLKFIYIKKKKR